MYAGTTVAGSQCVVTICYMLQAFGGKTGRKKSRTSCAHQ